MWSVSFSSSGVIDNKGLTYAVYSATKRSILKLKKTGYINDNSKILLDGLLKAQAYFKDQKTIIGGDDKEKIIALASICAKVCRDKKMKNLAKKYPQYGFEIHKGYGTKSHYKALAKHGPSPAHRRRFLRRLLTNT